MKIVLSRKGFDSGSGGCASPIINGSKLLSLPIPDFRSVFKYGDLKVTVDYGQMVEQLSKGRVRSRTPAHLDPDLDYDAVPRLEGWKPAFGQTAAAQAHLEANQVGIGDLFLFFGWFRDAAVAADGRWGFTAGGRNIHAVFGWIQVGAILPLPNGVDEEWAHLPWLANHPHVRRGPEARNVVYVASDELVLPGIGKTGLRGGGSVRELTELTTLTAPGAKNRSLWKLPRWFAAAEDRPPLSYHGSPGRWQADGEHVFLSSVARGQEFVLDCSNRPAAMRWAFDLLSDSPHL